MGTPARYLGSFSAIIEAGVSRSVWEFIYWYSQKVRPLPEHPFLPLARTQRATFISCPLAESRLCDQEFLAGKAVFGEALQKSDKPAINLNTAGLNPEI